MSISSGGHAVRPEELSYRCPSRLCYVVLGRSFSERKKKCTHASNFDFSARAENLASPRSTSCAVRASATVKSDPTFAHSPDSTQTSESSSAPGGLPDPRRPGEPNIAPRIPRGTIFLHTEERQAPSTSATITLSLVVAKILLGRCDGAGPQTPGCASYREATGPC